MIGSSLFILLFGTILLFLEFELWNLWVIIDYQWRHSRPFYEEKDREDGSSIGWKPVERVDQLRVIVINMPAGKIILNLNNLQLTLTIRLSTLLQQFLNFLLIHPINMPPKPLKHQIQKQNPPTPSQHNILAIRLQLASLESRPASRLDLVVDGRRFARLAGRFGLLEDEEIYCVY